MRGFFLRSWAKLSFLYMALIKSLTDANVLIRIISSMQLWCKNNFLPPLKNIFFALLSVACVIQRLFSALVNEKRHTSDLKTHLYLFIFLHFSWRTLLKHHNHDIYEEMLSLMFSLRNCISSYVLVKESPVYSLVPIFMNKK